MERVNIGEFEELVLLTVAILNEDAYGVTVREEIFSQTGRKQNISSIHATLDRLEKKGMVESFLGGATHLRGGRRKRLFKVTAYGVRVMKYTREQRNALYNQIPEMVLKLSRYATS